MADLQTLDTILICAANSADEPLSLELEVREIANSLRHSRKQFRLEQQWAFRPAELRRALLDYRPTFVHFSGHGSGPDGLVVDGQLLDGEALAELFRIFSGTIKCVVLNACFSVVQAEAIAKHIDHVIGMKRAIGDEAAIEFSTGFYDSIGAGDPVGFAFDVACVSIRLRNLPDYLFPKLIPRPAQQSAGENDHSQPITRDYPPCAF